MKVNGEDYRAVWWEEGAVGFIDQRLLPHRFESASAATVARVADAISEMAVRGAPTIGVMGGYGMALAALSGDSLSDAYDELLSTRPTAINLKVGLDAVMSAEPDARSMLAAAVAHDDAEVAAARAIGRHGSGLLVHSSRVLTHCNAGWLATVDWGTATAPMYAAKRRGEDWIMNNSDYRFRPPRRRFPVYFKFRDRRRGRRRYRDRNREISMSRSWNPAAARQPGAGPPTGAASRYHGHAASETRRPARR